MATNTIVDARAVFETTVSRLSQRPETLGKCKPIYAFFHEYESHYGELSQVAKLEKRMTDLFPGEESISTFAHRHSARGFDPTSVRPIVSPATQARPKGLPIIASALSPTHSPRPNTVSITRSINSPKRPFNQDDSDSELAPHQQSLQPRKLPRGESPLRGAAGRRVIDAKRFQQREGMPAANNGNAGAAVAELPREVMFLLSIIPRADTYRSSVFNPQRMVQLLRSTEMSRIPAAVSMQASGKFISNAHQPVPEMHIWRRSHGTSDIGRVGTYQYGR